MSIKGFIVNGSTQKYDYNELDNKPTIPSGGGVSDDLKEALLQLAEKIAYVDANGQDYYQDLYDALYGSATLSYITAVYTQSGTVYTTDSLNSLKSDLVVTAHYSDSTTSTVTNYTLSGTLTAGTSVITVTYQGKTTTFNVTVTAAPSTYTITNNLTSVTNSNNATTITEGNSYSATLTAASGYTINSVQITMGGNDVTGTSYSGGTITIANVTGNIVITAVATERQATLSSITAVFTQGSAVIYNTDSLDSLKQYLVVTAHWSDNTTSTVPANDYTLSGTLTAGTSTITVSYGGKTTTFTCTVTQWVTDPVITDYDKTYNSSMAMDTLTGSCITKAYEYTLDIDAFKQTQYYDSANNYANSNGSLFILKYYCPNSGGISFGAKGKSVVFNASDTGITYVSTDRTQEKQWLSERYVSGFFTSTGNVVKFRFNLVTADINNSYAYWTKASNTNLLPIGVTDGDIIFAGSNTQYYGKRNIND